jgi:hypothetical protein
LKSRKFWFTVVTLFAILIGNYLPETGKIFEENADALAGAVSLLAVYVVSLAIDPGSGWVGLLKSRKFYAMLVGLIIMVMDMFKIGLPYGMTGEQITSICVVASGYIVSVAFDGKGKFLTLSRNANSLDRMVKGRG